MTFNKVILAAILFLMTGMHSGLAVNQGLRNLGNTCYMNASLQCLMHCNDFTNYLSSEKNVITRDKYPITYEFIRLLGMMKEALNTVSPNNFYNVGFYDAKGSQQDAFDFIAQFFKEQYARTVFFGKNFLSTKCNHCDFESKSYEDFTMLDLELYSYGDSGKKMYTSLEECLESFYEGKDRSEWKCDNGHTGGISSKLLENLPQHLIMHFLRFSINLETGQYEKINTNISFKEHIDLTLYAKENARYELVGFICHSGYMNSKTGEVGGHYYSYCKDQENNQWYKFNDSAVSPAHAIIKRIQEQKAEQGNPYILFYKRQDIPPVEPEPEEPEPKPEPTPPAFAEFIIDEELKKQLLDVNTSSALKTAFLRSLLEQNQSYFFAKTEDGESPLHLFIDYLKNLFESESGIKEGFFGNEIKQELNPKTYFKYFRFLVENFDINAQLPESQETIMHILIQDQTLQNYINAHAQGNDEYEFLSFLSILLEQKPNYNLVNQYGRTAFYSLIFNLSPEAENFVYQIINNYDVFIDVPSYNKQNVLHLLMQQYGDSNKKIANNILNYLINSASTKNFSNAIPEVKKGLCQLIRTQDDYGKTPLHYALEKDNLAGAKILLALLFKHGQGNESVLNLTSKSYEDPGKSIQKLIMVKGLSNFTEQLKKDYPDQREPVTEQTISKIMIIILQELNKNEKTKNAITNSIAQFATFKNEILLEIEDKDPQPTLDELYELIKNKILKVILQSPLEQKLNSLKKNLVALKGRLSTLKDNLNTLKTKLSGHKK